MQHFSSYEQFFARDLGKEKHEKDYIPSSRVPRDLNMESQGLNYTSSKDLFSLQMASVIPRVMQT